MRRAVVTGASRGIGAAIVRRLAAPGAGLLLVARSAEGLATVAEAARRAGAEVETAAIGVEDPALADRLRAYDTAGPVDLLVANAGLAGGRRPDGREETAGSIAALAAVNYLGAVATVEALLPAMRRRRAGRIALVGSLASVRPLPGMRGYAGSKAALAGYATALRADLRGTGVSASLVLPGFVATEMSARHHGPRPFTVSTDSAAATILRGVARRRGVIAFPWPTVLMSRLCAGLPPALSDALARRFDATVDDPAP